MRASDWLQTVETARAGGEACIMVTVAAVEGSTPREAGAKMIVFADRIVGTIGGGALEQTAIDLARRDLQAALTAPRLETLPLGPALGQCCGGRVTLLLEPVLPVAARLVLFGAGHVGRALVTALDGLPVAVTWVDSRPAEMPDRVPSAVTPMVTDSPAMAVEMAAAGSFYLIMTHDHALDLALVEAILERGDAAWIGLIGSATKRARFTKELARRGLDMAPVTCPIGVPGIRAKQPQAIAIATAAQLLQAIEARHPLAGEGASSAPGDAPGARADAAPKRG